jgi:hypothetical protein
MFKNSLYPKVRVLNLKASISIAPLPQHLQQGKTILTPQLKPT